MCSAANGPRRKNEAKVKALLTQDTAIPKEAISHCVANLLALYWHEKKPRAKGLRGEPLELQMALNSPPFPGFKVILRAGHLG